MSSKKTLSVVLEEAEGMGNPIDSLNHITRGMQELSEKGITKAK